MTPAFFLTIFLIPDFKRRTKNPPCHKNKRDAVYFIGGFAADGEIEVTD